MRTPIPGDIILVHSTGLAARGIQLATLSRVNHAAIALGGGMLLEANPAGVQRKPVDEYAEGRIRAVLSFPLSQSGKGRLGQFVAEHEGDRYNWPGIFALGFDRFLGWRPPPLDRRADLDTTNFCSQLALLWLRFAGFDPLPGMPDWTCEPADLQDAYLLGV